MKQVTCVCINNCHWLTFASWLELNINDIMYWRCIQHLGMVFSISLVTSFYPLICDIFYRPNSPCPIVPVEWQYWFDFKFFRKLDVELLKSAIKCEYDCLISLFHCLFQFCGVDMAQFFNFYDLQVGMPANKGSVVFPERCMVPYFHPLLTSVAGEHLLPLCGAECSIDNVFGLVLDNVLVKLLDFLWPYAPIDDSPFSPLDEESFGFSMDMLH